MQVVTKNYHWSDTNETLQQISINLLRLLTPISILYIVVGIISLAANILMISTICCNKILHKRNYILLLLSAIGNTLISVHLTARGCLRTIYVSFEWPLVLTERQCMYREAPLLLAISFAYIIFLVAAIDRLLSSVMPVWYMTNNHCLLLCFKIFMGLCYIAVEIALLINGSSKENQIPICAFGMTTDRKLITGANYRVQATFCLVIILLASNIIYIKKQLTTTRRKGLNLSQTRKRFQVKITRTLMIMLICFMCTVWAAHVVYMISETIENLKHAALLASFAAILCSLSGVTNLAVMVCRSAEFKAGFHRCLTCCSKSTDDQRMITISPEPTQSFKLSLFNSSVY